MKLRNFTKTGLMVLLCGLLAACQTSGLKPGSIDSSFAPSGWQSESRGGKTIYFCMPSVCGSPQGVVIGPMKVRGDAEAAIREDILSTELLKAMDKVVNIAAKGDFRMSTDRRIVKKNFSGFDMSARLKDRNGRNVYAAARLIIQNDRGSMVASFATSRARARSNLRRFLNQTTIRRLP